MPGAPGLSAAAGAQGRAGTAMAILVSLSLCHFLNDMNQSLVPAIYPDPERTPTAWISARSA